MWLSTENILNLSIFTDTLATMCSFNTTLIPHQGLSILFQIENASLFLQCLWFSASAQPITKVGWDQ